MKKKIALYLKSALYNIRQNKVYALFCIVGTALTFIFVTIILQFGNTFLNNTPPGVNVDRTISVSYWKKDHQGRYLGYFTKEEIPNIMKHVKGYETYSFIQGQPLNLLINDQLKSNFIYYVNHDFWKIYQFQFLEGRPFTEKELQSPVAVITESCAKLYFRNGSALNQTMEAQGVTYKVIGVVKDFSFIVVNPAATIWAPYAFNHFWPNRTRSYDLYIMFPRDMPESQMRKNVANAFIAYNKEQNREIEIYPEDFNTILSGRMNSKGITGMDYEFFLMIILLLIIPAVNIITLNIANTANRSEEIGIRRAMGAGKMSSFLQIMTENILLVLTGTLLGVLIVYPIFNGINNILLTAFVCEGSILFPELKISIVLFQVLPLSIVFSFLAGGLPAYWIAQRNIAEILKGGKK